jgi:hypothetical protein
MVVGYLVFCFAQKLDQLIRALLPLFENMISLYDSKSYVHNEESVRIHHQQILNGRCIIRHLNRVPRFQYQNALFYFQTSRFPPSSSGHL